MHVRILTPRQLTLARVHALIRWCAFHALSHDVHVRTVAYLARNAAYDWFAAVQRGESCPTLVAAALDAVACLDAELADLALSCERALAS